MKKELIGIDSIFDVKGADREAKAYSFLYAAFKKTEVNKNPVRDALDCLVPFIIPFARGRVGAQVNASDIKAFMEESYGFDLPLYAIDQLFSTLISSGIVRIHRATRAYIVDKADASFDVAKSEIEDDFQSITTDLENYARRLGFDIPPPSGEWGKALLNFLKTRTDRKIPKLINIKNALLDPQNLETAVVGGYINHLHTENRDSFDKLLKIFMGTLIEDFLTTITELGSIDSSKPVTVFYDTSLLLRQLGSSIRELRQATHELTRYLQDLGFEIKYFSGNEAEVANIIDTIIHVKDSGRELEGETAAAIADGDVSITHIRAMQNAFTEKLAQFGIFPADRIEKDIHDNERYQINELGLAEYIKNEARAHGRTYGAQNSQNDASYVGNVMRLRRRIQGRDLADCRFVFVTSNRFLAVQSRRYLIREKQLSPQQVPPVLAVGQLATICWLLKDHTLPPEQAGKELLSNCYAAIRPDADWFRYFKEGMESVVGNFDSEAENQIGSIALQAARRIAQEESFSSTAVVRQLNMAEIVQRAKEEEQRQIRAIEKVAQDRQDQLEIALRKQHEDSQAVLEVERQKAISERELAVERSAKAAADKVRSEIHQQKKRRSMHFANQLFATLKWFTFALFVFTSALAIYAQNTGWSGNALWVCVAISFLMSAVSALDTLGIKFARAMGEKVHQKTANFIYDIL